MGQHSYADREGLVFCAAYPCRRRIAPNQLLCRHHREALPPGLRARLAAIDPRDLLIRPLSAPGVLESLELAADAVDALAGKDVWSSYRNRAHRWRETCERQPVTAINPAHRGPTTQPTLIDTTSPNGAYQGPGRER
jgi:hypothetical protein